MHFKQTKVLCQIFELCCDLCFFPVVIDFAADWSQNISKSNRNQ